METKVYTASDIKEADQRLREGKLVSFPTETVYGLGAIASNDQAVKDVYRVKGRPSDNPLIVHVASIDIEKYVQSVPEEAYQLMKVFWPGPLTLIFKAKEGVFAPTVTSGHSTIAMRMPDQPLAIQLIEAVGFPIVGPSANISGKPSPTTPDHVLHDLSGKIAGVVDGRETSIGVESTVLDLTSEKGPAVMRPGAITPQEIEQVIHRIVRFGGHSSEKDTDAPIAPGMKYTHYSPRQPVYIITGNEKDWITFVEKLQKEHQKIGILASDETIHYLNDINVEGLLTCSLGKRRLIQEASQRLYAGLRYFDDKEIDYILAEAYPKVGIGEAFMNRLEKASSGFYPTEIS